MSTPIYAIGDLHGQVGMLDTALERIEQDGGARARLVFVGDYVDRGPDSKAVIETLVQGQHAGNDWVCLKGNHDRMFEWFIQPEGPRHDATMIVGYHWLHERIGGAETLRSYGIEVPERIRQKDLAAQFRDVLPDSHAAFLNGLALSHQQDGLFFVHAGLRPGVDLSSQSEEDFLWIRQEFLTSSEDHGVFVVHGHTPVKTPDMYSNRLNLDTGAGYDRPLTTAVYEDGQWFALGPSGRERLSPDAN